MFDFLKNRRIPAELPAGTVRRHYRIEGRVQGVGFRYRAKYAAQELGLTGYAENLDDGSVEMELQGDPKKMDRVFAIIQRSDYILITDMKCHDVPLEPRERDFSVLGY